MENLQVIPISSNCEQTKDEYKKSSSTEIHEVLQSLRRYVLNDLKRQISIN